MDLLFIIILMICCWIPTGQTTAACAPQNKMVTLDKHLGSSFHFQCKPTLCNAVKHNYTHYDQITGKPDLVKQSSKFTQKLSSFEHGGKYCCHNQCGDDKSIVSTSGASECCINVAILPIIQWDLPKAVALNGNAVTGSCSASGYPRPDITVIIPLCDYQQNNVHIGRYTTKAVFTMNITRNCDRIYCLIRSKTYSILKTNKLLIVENVSCGATRQTRSIPTAIDKSISKEQNSIIMTKDIEIDDEAGTYARGNGITTSTSA